MRLPGKVSAEMRQRRVSALLALSAQKQLEFQERQREHIAEVLFERDRGDGLARGLTENYLRVEVPANQPGSLQNQLAKVRLLACGREAMRGELCGPASSAGLAAADLSAEPRTRGAPAAYIPPAGASP